MITKSIFSLMCLISISVQATELEDVQTELRKNLKNTTLTSVKVSPIAGIYEVQTGENIIYYAKNDKVFIFGEFFDIDGKNLTAESKHLSQIEMLSQIEKEAITFGDDNSVNNIVEFTDPDCPYCRKVDDLLNSFEGSIKRSTIFVADRHASAKPKVEHLICLDDPVQRKSDMKRIMQGDVFDFKTCERSNEIISKHREIAQKMRVKGTPVLFVNNTRVEGADLEKIRNLLLKEGNQ